MKNDSQVNCRLPQSLKEQIEESAKGLGISVSQWMLEAAKAKLSQGSITNTIGNTSKDFPQSVDNTVDSNLYNNVDNHRQSVDNSVDNHVDNYQESVDNIYTTVKELVGEAKEDIVHIDSRLTEKINNLERLNQTLQGHIKALEARITALETKPKPRKPRTPKSNQTNLESDSGRDNQDIRQTSLFDDENSNHRD